MSLISLGIIWGLLFIVVLALAGVRKSMTKNELDTVHLTDTNAGVIHKQQTLDSTLNQIDRWGKILTVATVLYGVALLARVIYMGWLDSAQLHN